MFYQPLKSIIATICLFISVCVIGQVPESQIEIFEKILGFEESRAFDKVLEAFEFHLDTTYPGVSRKKAIENYLQQIIEDGYDNWYFDETKLMKKRLIQSGLVAALGMYPDSSVISENNLLLFKYGYDLKNNKTNDLVKVHTDVDTFKLTKLHHRELETLTNSYARQYFFINYSKFLIGLYVSTDQSDSTFSQYLEATEFGPTRIQAWAHGLSRYHHMFGNYFFNRILVKELFIPRFIKIGSPFKLDQPHYFLDHKFQKTGENNAHYIRFYRYLKDTTIKVTDFESYNRLYQESILNIDPYQWKPESLANNLLDAPRNHLLEEPDYGIYHIRNGSFKRYDYDGSLLISGAFKEYKKHGEFREYFGENQLKSVFVYDNSLKIDHPFLIMEYYDIDGNHLVKNGVGQYREHNSSSSFEGSVYGGRKTGIWIGKGSRGNGLKYKEVYIEGVLMEGECMDKEGKKDAYTMINEKPEFVGGDPAMFRYLGQNIDYPIQALRIGIEGIVYVQFVVQQDGKITHVQALRGIGAGCDEEAEKVVRLMPKWNPGKYRGKETAVRMVLPVIFKLND